MEWVELFELGEEREIDKYIWYRRRVLDYR